MVFSNSKSEVEEEKWSENMSAIIQNREEEEIMIESMD